MKIILRALGNAGYGADQVKGITVRELKDLLEDLQDDDVIITKNLSNRYGANYGEIYAEIIGEYDEENDEEIEY